MKKMIAAAFAALALTVTLAACGDAEAEPKAATENVQESSTPTPIASETPDPDQDGDGMLDVDDAFPMDPDEWADEDSNGTGDNADAKRAEHQRKAEAKRKREAEAAAKAAAALATKINNAHSPTERQWALIVKNPDAHAGEVYVLYAEIYQFDAATGTSNFLAYAAPTDARSYGYFEGDDAASFNGGPRQLAPFIEDDVVVTTVQVVGSYSFDTQAGGNTTVPELNVLRIART